MGGIFEFPKPAEKEEDPINDYIGLCPGCLSYDGCLNVHSKHLFLCSEHKSKCRIGSNSFSNWRHETEEAWRADERQLADYQEAKHAFYDDSAA